MNAAAVQAKEKTTETKQDVNSALVDMLGRVESLSDEDVGNLQALINSVMVSMLSALTSPFSNSLDNFLGGLRRVASKAGAELGTLVRQRSFYVGQFHALAELAEAVRHMKVPAEAAAVILNRGDALEIARILTERDAVTKSELAQLLSKQQSNLHRVLQEMERCGLIRRDEIGRSVVYSPTPLTAVCLQWAEKEEEAAVQPRYGVAG